MDKSVQQLMNFLVELDEKSVMSQVQEIIRSTPEFGMEKNNEIIKACQQGMGMIGDRFSQGEYFLPELMLSANIFEQIIGLLPKNFAGKTGFLGRIVLGTVRSDVHDIGKNIVGAMLEASGFEVIDLGVDISEEKFLEEVKKTKPQILAMSALLTSSLEPMKSTVEFIKQAGLRESLKIIIGGSVVSEMSCNFVGADAFTTDAAKGVQICKGWVSGE
ncbi:cobalamin B12-binding domain-containing protein [Candidatus Formimonas warabiya]|uniref:Cobalamin-binding protein n=1 Tax=Formimonas warabiya TaxID=1761012 RepID=A0A3G1KQN0_FORW1|nr:cobalamin-dependent protein [Candidatus Formimonas warabiya]ATW24746.1 hypothetical protein DCMF_08130 [Candidatus Formimonas warabiya]